MENKIKLLANILVEHSLKVKKGDRVLIQSSTLESKELIEELIKLIYQKQAIPFLEIYNQDINELLSIGNTKERISEIKKRKAFEVENIDCYIHILYNINDYTSNKINKDMKKLLGIELNDINDIRVNKRRWVLLNYPSSLDAYKAKMSNQEFYDYAMNVMTIDYNKMLKDMEPLKKLMEKTDKVRVTGKNTDITFSIKNIPAICCSGSANIPDGEVYTAPVKESVNGVITYNTPSPYDGKVYHNVSLTFEKGRIIKATCDEDDKDLNEIFDKDDGARYIGEFSFGLNPMITEPIGDILYDEKIIGSIHFTPGESYKDAYNGNNSMIHWDMVLIQRSEYGGGEVYFDDVLIRKDGKFILNELKKLN